MFNLGCAEVDQLLDLLVYKVGFQLCVKQMIKWTDYTGEHMLLLYDTDKMTSSD